MSLFVRPVAVSARHYGLAYERLPLSTVDNRDGVKAFNPIAGVPVIEHADGTRIVDSSVTIDYFDQRVALERRLIPPSGADRSRILSLTAIALGSAQKMILSFYEQSRAPPQFVYGP